jgi:hypothetical protein
LGKHLSAVHGVTSIQYLEQHPNAQVKCSKTRERYSCQNKKNGDWIERRKAAGDDLSDYREKMGQAVSDAIMSNPEERQRRARQMAKNNRMPEARQRSRETAIKTSARPEIQRARAERLRRWREENFEEFYEKCVKAAHSVWFSKPELALKPILDSVEGYRFKHNQVVKSEQFQNKSKRKQVDYGDKSLRTYVEFDGIIHFESRVKGQKTYEKIQVQDSMLDHHVIQHGWTLIRISYDQFIYGKQEDGSPGRFKDECIRQLLEHLRDPQPGVYRIGEAYNEEE